MSSLYRITLFSVLACLLLVSCQNDNKDNSIEKQAPKEATKFRKVNNSGIDFANNLEEDVVKNYLNFEYIYNGGGVALGDVNNDGLVDIYFSGNEVSNKLYLNKGDLKFEDVSEKAGIVQKDSWDYGVSMVDINGDGWLDIYVCRSTWKKKGDSNTANLLYINQKNGTFKESGELFGLAEKGYSIQASFFDYDNDGDLDAYITNHPMEFVQDVKNRDKKFANPPYKVRDKLYRNDG